MRQFPLFLISVVYAGLFLFRFEALGQPPNTQFLPAPKADVQVIHHKGFSLGYSEEHEQASWVAYVMSRARLIKVVDRADDFRPDPSVRT